MVYQSVGGQVKDIRRHPTFTETFYSVTIVLDADETISVDGASSPIGHYVEVLFRERLQRLLVQPLDRPVGHGHGTDGTVDP